MEKRVRTFGRVSEHGLLTSVQELDDLIANVQVPTVIEVQAIFEDEFVEHIRGTHLKKSITSTPAARAISSP